MLIGCSIWGVICAHWVLGVCVLYIITLSLPYRDDVLQSLAIVQHCLLGAGSMLPPLEGQVVSGL